ncbi:metallophosphoesterase [Microbulbifer sp. 2205BS26-8]|uniref:metallophosphoesterase n=1 Tax=Microbulbifer sp. 2205BS26-8 TaxID=3064386 RepID=UPI00273DF427|nr:metallophosphoesterase [Microbulbifer sp. 2205BS26-8]MDP5210195.1 metallophosphoesterase [Microbulbifer sp. 2205BS26-8]
MRVFAISDMHFDYDINAQWVDNVSLYDFRDDILILAGDISHDISRIRACIEQFSLRFKKALFVTGNHDLWVVGKECESSFDKFDCVRQIVLDAGASMEPYHDAGLSIVPLLSWYDYSFGSPSERLCEIWMDYNACRWPHHFDDKDVNQYFLKKNEAYLHIRNQHVITFSHFLPRIDVMPSYIPPKYRVIYPVLGSDALDTQVRALQANTHVYGHSHVNQKIRISGVDYINNAFGTPGEAHFTSRGLLCVYEH